MPRNAPIPPKSPVDGADDGFAFEPLEEFFTDLPTPLRAPLVVPAPALVPAVVVPAFFPACPTPFAPPLPEPLFDPGPDPVLLVGAGVQNSVSVVWPIGAVGCGFAVCEKQVGETPGVSANAGATEAGTIATTANALANAIVASASNGTIRTLFNEPHLLRGLTRH